MNVVVIGGTGHIGTYLVPRLVALGYQVTNVSRGDSKPYHDHAAWKQVETVIIDRKSSEEKGTFAAQIAELNPDVVIDNICFTLESAQHLVEGLKGKVQQFIHCGTVWVHGPSTVVPTTETAPRRPFGEYGIQKEKIEAYLLDEARRNGFPVSILHPGHIVGPGWKPINPAGHLNLDVFTKLARGEELLLPNFGMETLHHVHADDVAQSYIQAMTYWSSAVGESFHSVSAGALTLRGYAEAVAAYFGQEANIKYLPWEEWKAQHSENEAQATWDHIAHSPNCSIAKAQRLINYQPRYTSLQAIFEALDWLIANGELEI